MSLLLEELKSFSKIFIFLTRTEKWHTENQNGLLLVKEKIQALRVSTSSSVLDTIRRTSKGDKLAQLKLQEEEYEENTKFGDELLKLAYSVIASTEITFLKRQKNIRHNLLIKKFSEAKIKQVESQLRFWHCVKTSL